MPLLLKTALAVALTGAAWPPLWPQSRTAEPPAGQSPATQSPTPDWQTAAGGKMSFDVASVKQNKSGNASANNPPYSNVPLSPGDIYSATGGLLSATNWPLWQYMVFAYKLGGNELQAVRTELPKWAATDRFDIQARATGNPTKDQMRLMMQSLLADRFKLTLHYESRQLPVFALSFWRKAGKTGPQFQAHPTPALLHGQTLRYPPRQRRHQQRLRAASRALAGA